MSRVETFAKILQQSVTANDEKGKVAKMVCLLVSLMLPANFPELSSEIQAILHKDVLKDAKEAGKMFVKDTRKGMESQLSRFFKVAKSPVCADVFAEWRNGEYNETLSAMLEEIREEKVQEDVTEGAALEWLVTRGANLPKLHKLIGEFIAMRQSEEASEEEVFEEVEA